MVISDRGVKYLNNDVPAAPPDISEKLRIIDSVKDPQELAELLREEIVEPRVYAHGIRPAVLSEHVTFVGKHPLRRILRLLGKLIARAGYAVTKREIWNKARYALNVHHELYPHVLRLLDIATNPEPWQQLYSVLDTEGRDALMRWLKAGVAALAYDVIYAFNRYSLVSVEEYLRVVNELERHAKSSPDGLDNLKLFSVKGEKKVYNIITYSMLLASVWNFEEYPPPPPTAEFIVDVGAFTGETSIWLYDKAEKDVTIYAFEPDKRIKSVLTRNVRTNNLDKHIVIFEYALSDRDGRVALEPCEPGSASLSSAPRGEEKGLTVEARRLDTLIEKGFLRSIDYIKIDVEGHDLQVLTGGVKALREFTPVVAVAAYHKPRDPVLLYRLLSSVGYEKFTLRFRLPFFYEVVLVATP